MEVKIQDPFLEPGEIETDQEERLRCYFEELLQIKDWDAPAAITQCLSENVTF